MKIVRPDFFAIASQKTNTIIYDPENKAQLEGKNNNNINDMISSLDSLLGNVVADMFISKLMEKHGEKSYDLDSIMTIDDLLSDPRLSNIRTEFQKNEEKEQNYDGSQYNSVLKIPDSILYDEETEKEDVDDVTEIPPKSIDILTAYKNPDILFSDFKCRLDPDLFDYVKENFNGRKLTDVIPLLNKIYSFRAIKKFPQGEIVILKNLENSVLFSIELSKEESDKCLGYPFICAAFRDEENKVSIFVPYFGNTLKIDEQNEKLCMCDLRNESHLFDAGGFFKYINMDLIEMNTKYSLVDLNKFKSKVDIRNYGSYKTKGYSVNEDYSIYIGDLTFKNNQVTKMFKKDYNIPLDTKSCEINLKIKGIRNKHLLTIVADIFGAITASYLSNNSKEVPSFISNVIKYENDKLYLNININRNELKPLFEWSKWS